MNMWKWLMRKLPKRVITYDGKEYFPQVWFIWWHYIWTDCSELATAECFKTIDEAVDWMKIRWAPEEKRLKKIVWRSRDGEES